MEKQEFVNSVRHFVCEMLKHQNILVKMEERREDFMSSADIITYNLQISIMGKKELTDGK